MKINLKMKVNYNKQNKISAHLYNKRIQKLIVGINSIQAMKNKINLIKILKNLIETIIKIRLKINKYKFRAHNYI